MADKFYPSVDIDFILEHVRVSDKLADDGIIKIGSTTSIISKGSQAIFKRTTLIRELEPSQVCFEQAIALAIKYNFMTPLLKWWEDKKGWKEGGYTLTQQEG